MSIKNGMLIFLCATVYSFQVFSTELWSNISEGFAAKFSQNPERIDAATSKSTGYAYQSAISFNNGGALYAITVVPISSNILKKEPLELLEGANAEFIKSMGQNPSRAKIRWAKFGDNRMRLNYGFDFNYNGVPFKAYGFWVIDNNRVIRVSVSYTKSLPADEASEVISFLDSFTLLTKPK